MPEENSAPQKPKKKKSAGWQAVLLLVVILAIPFTIATFQYPLGVIGFDYTYSEGVRVGQVVKVSERGLIWKTFEGSLGVTQSGAYVEKWDFSVDASREDGEQLVASLLEAAKTGELVEIKYTQRIGVRPWRAKTSYLVEEVTILRN